MFARSIEAFAQAHRLKNSVERKAFLEELERESPVLRAEVEDLLSFESSARDQAVEGADAESVLPTISGCLLLDVIGSGGFGTVYRARRASDDLSPVAVKVLHGSEVSRSSQRRFLRERQLHARVRSPYVAQVFDVGTTVEGDPYLMMELVEGGQTIIEYAGAKRLRTAQRIDLFRKVCSGVEAFHVNGIYHRDLKPSNILIQSSKVESIPKIIDFGLAKTDQENDLTAEQVRIGTPGYMSPEQSAGDSIDLRTDVYSLGVLLQELLTGARPTFTQSRETPLLAASKQINGSSAALAERGVRSQRELEHKIRGDLDAIIAKCLYPNREHRYQSAHELNADLGRHVSHEPVLARGPQGIYALSRLMRRHRVASVSVVVGLLSLMGGLLIASLAWAQQRAANKALGERNQELARVVAYEKERLASIDPGRVAPHLQAEILARAQEGVDILYAGQVPGPVMEEFERVLANTDLTTVALEVLRQGVFHDAADVINREFRAWPGLRATLLVELSDNLTRVGLLDMALPPLDQALSIRTQELGKSHPDTLATLGAKGRLMRKFGRYKDAIAVLDRALELASVDPKRNADRILLLRNQRVLTNVEQFESPGAIQELEELLPAFQETFGDENDLTLDLSLQLAQALARTEDPGPSIERISTIQQQLERLGGSDGFASLMALLTLGKSQMRAARWEESAESIRRSLAGLNRQLGSRHPTVLSAAGLLAQVYLNEGNFGDATTVLEQTTKALEEQYGPRSLKTVLAMANLAHVLRMVPDLDRALPLGRRSVELGRSILPRENPKLGSLLVENARTLFACGEVIAAEVEFLEGYDILADALGADDVETKTAAEALMLYYELMNERNPNAGYEEQRSHWEARSQGFVMPQSDVLKEELRSRLFDGKQDALPAAEEAESSDRRDGG